MISKPIGTELDLADLERLIESPIRESKTIEYKREIDLSTDKGKAKFLAGVCAFANTDGGDFVIGIEAVDGVPVSISGVEIKTVDEALQQFNNMFVDNFEPRIPNFHIDHVPIENGRFVQVIRIPRSRQRPHRIRANNHFYARNSSGKYILDVGQIREAFLASETAVDKVRRFRADRISKIFGIDELPGIELADGIKSVVHVVPLVSSDGQGMPVSALKSQGHDLHPAPYGITYAVNIEGLLTYSTDDNGAQIIAYSQVFRNGSVEVVFVTAPSSRGHKNLYTNEMETMIVDTAENSIALNKQHGVQPPFAVFFSILDGRGYSIGSVMSAVQSARRREIDRDRIDYPEILITDFDANLSRELRPIIDGIYHAFGLDGSKNFDHEGNWDRPQT